MSAAAHPLLSARRSGRAPVRPAAVGVAVVTAGWTVIAVSARYGELRLPSVPHAVDAVIVGFPLLLLAALSLRSNARAPSLLLAGAWSGVVATALELAPVVSDHSSFALILPAAVTTAWVLDHRPAVGIGLVLAVTASFGALVAYLSEPYTRTVDFVLVALWLALVGRMVLVGRVRPTRWSAGMSLLLAYLAITFVQVLLADDVHRALSAYEFTDWFILALPLVALSQWEKPTLDRMASVLVVAAVLVGAYACLRMVIGPSGPERTLGETSPFNLVNGKLKLLGSFPNGADLGAWAALIMPFCLSCALGWRSYRRWLAALAIPLLVVSIYGASLRSGAVAALFSLLVVLVLHQVCSAFRTGRIGRVAVAVAAVAAVAVGGYAVAGVNSSSTHSFSALLTFSSHDVSVAHHRYKWSQAFRDIQAHPFGYGVGTAPTGYTSTQHGSANSLSNFSVDNGYLKIGLEQGFAIMVTFALALVVLLAGLARRAVSTLDPGAATIAIGSAGTLMALIVLEGAGAFIDGLPALAAWIAIGLGLAQFQMNRGQVKSAR